MRKMLWLTLASATAVAVAACGDNVGTGACIDDGTLYSYVLGGDTGLVFNWPGGRQPVRIWAEPVGDLPQNVTTAASRWVNGLRCDELRAVVVSDSSTADIIVRQPQSAPVPVAGVRLAADSIGACGGVTLADFVDSTLTMTGPLRVSIYPLGTDSVALAGCYRMVAIHELGHAFGILAHSPDAGDIMYSVPRRSTLSARDRKTFQFLYHTSPTIRPAP